VIENEIVLNIHLTNIFIKAKVLLPRAVYNELLLASIDKKIEFHVAKGPVFSTAIIAGKFKKT
jgi:hypothetical protein